MKAEKPENVFDLWSNSRKYDPFEIQAKQKIERVSADFFPLLYSIGAGS
jgi:hypothetical protein